MSDLFTTEELDKLRAWRDILDDLGRADFELDVSQGFGEGHVTINIKCRPKPGMLVMESMARTYLGAPTALSAVIRRVLGDSKKPTP